MAEVLVIGGANVDIKAKTLAKHIGATSNPAEIVIKPGGVGRNIAHNLARLGVKTSLMTVIGKDANGEIILSATKKAGVNISHIKRVNAPTGTYLAILGKNGELITAASDMAILSFLTNGHLVRNKNIVKNKSLIVADCNLAEKTLLELARYSERLVVEPVSVSKCLRLLELLKTAKVFLATPNLDQLRALTNEANPERAAQILHRKGLQNLVVHAGRLGAYVSNAQGFVYIPSQARKISDVTGAGDAATAGLVAGLVKGLTLAKAAALGQKMAAKVITSQLSTLK